MDAPLPVPRRVMVSTGSPPSPHFAELARSYPFTKQLDVVFPYSKELEATLSKLKSHYAKGLFKLSEILEDAAFFTNGPSSSRLRLTALVNEYISTDDTWCIDHRGLLSLSVCKETYERLGLPGTKLPFKGCSDQYAIRIPLYDSNGLSSHLTKVKNALKAWDASREKDEGKWEVLYHLHSDTSEYPQKKGHTIIPVNFQSRSSSSIRIPIPIILPKPAASHEDDLQDWNEGINDLFEWVTMAGLGAQRLDANDRVSPYIAVYEPPESSRIGNVTHLRWRGLLSPEFVQSIIDTATNHVSSLSTPFVSITAHGFPTSPVAYISPSAFDHDMNNADRFTSPLRAPGPNTENTWSLILAHNETQDREGQVDLRWVKAESVGQWDMRWG